MPMDDGRGPVGRLSRFVLATLVLFAAVFVGGTAFAPPDPFTQLRVVGLGLAAAFLATYWLVYRRGWDRLRAGLGG